MANSWNDFRKDQQQKRLGEDKERNAKDREPELFSEASAWSDDQAKAEEAAPRTASSRTGRSARPARPARAAASVRTIRRRRRMTIRLLLLFAALIVVGISVYYYTFRRTYHDYRIIYSRTQEDTVSTRYVPLGKNILRYNQDGVSLIDNSLETKWSESYDMTNPTVDVREKHAVIADKDGTTLVMVGEEGITGTTNTSYSIIKAKVSNNGLVAAILDGGGDTWINFYATDGSTIAQNQTTLEDPGYPLDVSLSDNGMIMMVTYQFIKGSNITSYVAFYNFGDVGQNADDRIVSGFRYEGHVIPQIQYLDHSHAVAFCDNGFIIYSGSQIPDEMAAVTTDKEIVSTFYDNDTVGLVFRNDSKDKPYTLEAYSISGKLKFRKDFGIAYTTIKMSGGYILMYNSAQLCVISSDGRQRYLGAIDGTISNVDKTGINRYLLVLDTGVNIMKLA